MQIQNNQNINFKGAKVKFSKQADAENPILRPLVNYLKHNCGGNSVQHHIQINDIQLGVDSSYKPITTLGDIDKFSKSFGIVGDNPVTKENVQKVIAELKETTSWYRNIKKMEKAQAANAKIEATDTQIVPQEKKSFLDKILTFFFTE